MIMPTAQPPRLHRKPATARQDAPRRVLRPRRLWLEQFEDRLLLSADFQLATQPATVADLSQFTTEDYWHALQAPPSAATASEGYIELFATGASDQVSLRSFGGAARYDVSGEASLSNAATSEADVILGQTISSSRQWASQTALSASEAPTASTIDETETASGSAPRDPSLAIRSEPHRETTMPRISQDDVPPASRAQGLIDPTPRRDDPSRVVVDLTVQRTIADRREVQHDSLSTARPDTLNGARGRGEAFDLAANGLPAEPPSLAHSPVTVPQAELTPAPDPTLLAESAVGPTPQVLAALAAHRTAMSLNLPSGSLAPPSSARLPLSIPVASTALDEASQEDASGAARTCPIVDDTALHDAALTAEAMPPTDEAKGVMIESDRPRDLCCTLVIGVLADCLTRDRRKRPYPLKANDSAQ